jgi:hypothetical protein
MDAIIDNQAQLYFIAGLVFLAAVKRATYASQNSGL